MKTKNFAEVIRKKLAKYPTLAKQVAEASQQAQAEMEAYAKLVDSLAPCPCCGKKVDFQHGCDPYDDFQRGVGFAVHCEPCNLSLWSFAQEHPEAVVQRWNRRVVKA